MVPTVKLYPVAPAEASQEIVEAKLPHVAFGAETGLAAQPGAKIGVVSFTTLSNNSLNLSVDTA